MSARENTAMRARKIIEEGLPIGPRMDPCVCGAGRHAHSGKTHGGACKATECRRYRPDTAWELAYRALDAQAMSLGDALREADRLDREEHRRLFPRGEGEWSISPSDAGACPKRIWYRNTPPEDYEPAITDGRAARMGTIIHAEVTRQMRRLFPWRIYGMRIKVEGLDRQSEIDSYDPLTGEVEDYKTAGDWKWDDLGDNGPDWDVWEQVLLYGLALSDQGYPVETVRLSYIKRCNGHDETFAMPFDREAAEAARQRLIGYATVLDMGGDLPRTRSGPTNDPLCRLCEARVHCWNMPQAEAMGRSPESLTILGAEPDDETIVWAVAEKVEAAAAKSAAEKRVEEAKVLMEGVEPGRYGDYEGYLTWGASQPSRKDWLAYVERLQEIMRLPEGMRPALDDIPLPQNRRYSYVKWGRVRKATLAAERKARAALDAADASGEAS